MAHGTDQSGRGRPSRGDAPAADGPAFDDPRDSDAGLLWMELAGVEPHPDPDPCPSRPGMSRSSALRTAGPRRSTAERDETVGSSVPGASAEPVDLGALLTRASDLPTPAPRAAEAGPTPLPWRSQETTGSGSAGRRSRAGRSAGTRRADRAAARTRETAEPPAPVIGAAAHAAEDEPQRRGGGADGQDFAPRRSRRPGPAPLPEDPQEREAAAREVVLRQLALGPRSRAQLERTLADREAEPELVARVLDRFEEVRLVDDAAFAEVWVRSRHRSRGLSRRAIGRELHEKGVDREVAEQALEGIDGDDERAAALDLVRRRLRGRPVPSGTSPEGRAERDKVIRRLVGMLGRRGYAPGLAFGVVKEALAELEA